VTLLAVVALTAACGDDDGATAPTTTTSVPTTEVVASLLTPDDLGADWSVTAMPQSDRGAIDGIVTDTQQQELPRPELCEAAGTAARDALASVRWKAFRSLELDVADPIRPPLDRSGHLVFLQQLLAEGSPERLRNTFDQVRKGFENCLGDIPADEEGPGRAEVMPVPDVGDLVTTSVDVLRSRRSL